MNDTFEVHYYGYSDPMETDDLAARVFKPHVVSAVKRRKSSFVASKPSPYKGVSFDKTRNNWQAYVGGGKTKRIKLGRFDTAERAADAVRSYLNTTKRNKTQ